MTYISNPMNICIDPPIIAAIPDTFPQVFLPGTDPIKHITRVTEQIIKDEAKACKIVDYGVSDFF